jgi:hypothetical protein
MEFYAVGGTELELQAVLAVAWTARQTKCSGCGGAQESGVGSAAFHLWDILTMSVHIVEDRGKVLGWMGM